MLNFMMMSLSIETAIVATSEVYDLMTTYKKRGIDVVPVKELEEAFSKATKQATGKNSLTNSLMEKIRKGDINVEI